MGFGGVKVVKFYDILMVQMQQNFDFASDVFGDFFSVLPGDGLLCQQKMALLLLDQIDERVRTDSDRSDAVEEESLGSVGERFGFSLEKLGGLLPREF
jgi:hypothetical protein